MAIRYFEDFPEGLTVELGSVEFTTDGIVEFARAWDPQTMHTDPVVAQSSIYGGLIAAMERQPDLIETDYRFHRSNQDCRATNPVSIMP